jgi:hypothetical protein
VSLFVAGGSGTYRWTLVDAPTSANVQSASAAVLSDSAGTTIMITPDYDGTYSGTVTDDIDTVDWSFYAGAALGNMGSGGYFPRRIPAFREVLGHNAPDAIDSAGNRKGWSREMRRWFAAINWLAGQVISGVANGLKSATTTVNVSAATAPTPGQLLTAVNSTSAQWANPPVTAKSWHTVVDLNFVTATNLAIPSDGAVTIGGVVFTKMGSFYQNAVTAGGVINGLGLMFNPTSANSPDNDSWNRPTLVANLKALYSSFDLLTPIRVSMVTAVSGTSSNKSGHFLSVGVANVVAGSGSQYTRSIIGVARRYTLDPSVAYDVQLYARANSVQGLILGATATAEMLALNQFRITLPDGIALGNALIEGSTANSGWDTTTLVPIGCCTGYALTYNGWSTALSSELARMSPNNAIVEIGAWESGIAGVTAPAIRALKIELFY